MTRVAGPSGPTGRESPAQPRAEAGGRRPGKKATPSWGLKGRENVYAAQTKISLPPMVMLPGMSRW
jgi:hypothetical protein